MENIIYDHYVAIDWSIKNMAIARMTKKTNKITVVDVPSDIEDCKAYLKNLKGKIVLTFEETTVANWMYTELKDHVDRLIVCDPHRNRLLSEGPKTDPIDAAKLVHLLKSGLLKEVYHKSQQFLTMRKLVSGYEDVIKSGVRLKNQRYSLLRGAGLSGKEKQGKAGLKNNFEQHVLSSLEEQIEFNEQQRKSYVKEFEKLSKQHSEIRHQKSLPGIGTINAVQIVARVVSPYRFSVNGCYLSYTGLIKHDKVSGGKSYGKQKPRYSRKLKSIYKTAVLAAIGGNNPINDYYEYLINEKRYTEYNARHKACRRIAILSLGVFKSRKKYQPYKKNYRRQDHVDQKQDISSGL